MKFSQSKSFLYLGMFVAVLALGCQSKSEQKEGAVADSMPAIITEIHTIDGKMVGEETAELIVVKDDVKLDVLIVTEAAASMTVGVNQIIDRRRWAIASLVARLVYSQTDFQLGFVSTASLDGSLLATPLGETLFTPATQNILKAVRSLMVAEQAEPIDPLLEKPEVLVDPPVPPEPPPPAAEPPPHMPLSVISQSLSLDSWRQDAKLLIVVITLSDPLMEDLTPDELIDSVDEANSGADWSIAVIVPDAEGCEIMDGVRTNPEGTPRRNLLLDVAALRDASTYSICNKGYGDFLGELINDSAGVRRNTRLEFVQPAKGNSITISKAGWPITGWSYVPQDKAIYLEPTIKAGTKLTVTYSLGVEGSKYVSLEESDNVPVLQEKKLSPEEIDYIRNINPVLRNYCGRCHGPGQQLTQFVDHYRNATRNKGLILERVALPLDEAFHMPPNQELDATSQSLLMEWGG